MNPKDIPRGYQRDSGPRTTGGNTLGDLANNLRERFDSVGARLLLSIAAGAVAMSIVVPEGISALDGEDLYNLKNIRDFYGQRGQGDALVRANEAVNRQLEVMASRNVGKEVALGAIAGGLVGGAVGLPWALQASSRRRPNRQAFSERRQQDERSQR
ncbi:hypothetical protein FWH58_00985 [Candidatus Saccharibacteria bacterium]|nr:hypothetical protein [Candidatus Saccharibacteria bacterium]